MTESPGFQPEVDLLPGRRMDRHRRDDVAAPLVWYYDEQSAVHANDNVPAGGLIEVPFVTKPQNPLHLAKIKAPQSHSIFEVVRPDYHLWFSIGLERSRSARWGAPA